MLHTYKAILRGNHVEWCGDVDQRIAVDHPVAVHITILEDLVAPVGVESQGERMATALVAGTALAHNHTLVRRNINDFKAIEELSVFNPFETTT